MRLNTIKNRLVLLFFAITTAAVGFVYLYVVPQLQSSLTTEKLSRLQELAAGKTGPIERAMRRGTSEGDLDLLLRRVSQRTDSRATLVALRGGSDGPVPAFVVADSESESTATQPRYDVAAAAARTGRVSSGVETVSDRRVGETAIPISVGGKPEWVAVFSSPLADVQDNVALIKRQIVIAGLIAIAAALLAGYYASRALSQRLRRLEEAAEKVAGGDFASPIPVDSSDELGQLARTFNEMQQRLARLDSARKEFIANASHELRTPIFSLGGFVELLEDEDPDPEARDEFVRTMRQQVNRLTKLTADLLDLSKLDSDAIEINPQSVDLTPLANSILSEFRPAADRRGSKIELRAGPGPAVARADPDRVGQIIRILLDNALKHTPEGTSVTVTTLRDNGGAELIVSDEGPGIDPRSLGRVFERFHTGDSASGSGLGLAIARELALRMEGRLDVASRRGFTAFTLELPLGDAAAAKRRRAGASA
jgi:two-component system, OmpR family, sensor kinase